jgi:hypothetical protein
MLCSYHGSLSSLEAVLDMALRIFSEVMSMSSSWGVEMELRLTGLGVWPLCWGQNIICTKFKSSALMI